MSEQNYCFVCREFKTSYSYTKLCINKTATLPICGERCFMELRSKMISIQYPFQYCVKYKKKKITKRHIFSDLDKVTAWAEEQKLTKLDEEKSPCMFGIYIQAEWPEPSRSEWLALGHCKGFEPAGMEDEDEATGKGRNEVILWQPSYTSFMQVLNDGDRDIFDDIGTIQIEMDPREFIKVKKDFIKVVKTVRKIYSELDKLIPAEDEEADEQEQPGAKRKRDV
jgi:hypothetical protein